jgi:putative membrane protein
MKQKKRAENFFTIEERDRITAAVVKAEQETAGEVATMVVDASDSYREAEILGAVLVAGAVSVMVAIVFKYITIWSYIPMVVVLFFPFLYLFRVRPDLKLPLIGRARLEEAVRERALRAFYEKGLYKTRDETGILIFISLLEHKVWIIGDRGINEKIEPDHWRHLASQVAQGMRTGSGCDMLCTVIEECGIILARHFPRRNDDINELSDRPYL